jgi:hypothetical protein
MAQEGNLGDIDLSHSECPLNEKCPYYADFKKDPSKFKGCPAKSASGNCPHLHDEDSKAKTGKIEKKGDVKSSSTKKKYGDGSDHDEL